MIRHRFRLAFPGSMPAADTFIDEFFGPPPKGDRLAVVAHFDPLGRVPAYLRMYIEDLRACGCDVVISSTAPHSDNDARAFFASTCLRTISRRNAGLDFAGWRLAVDRIGDLSRYKGVLLTNDSILGPLRSLATEFNRLGDEPDVLYGLNDSYEIRPHLQSYFLYVPIALFHSAMFRTFWNSVKALHYKDAVIQRYEIGLSQHIIRHGGRLEALYPARAVAAAARENPKHGQFLLRHDQGVPINPSLHFWRVLLDRFDYPFVKRELLTRNRIGADGIDDYIARLNQSNRPADKAIAAYLAGPTV